MLLNSSGAGEGLGCDETVMEVPKKVGLVQRVHVVPEQGTSEAFEQFFPFGRRRDRFYSAAALVSASAWRVVTTSLMESSLRARADRSAVGSSAMANGLVWILGESDGV